MLTLSQRSEITQSRQEAPTEAGQNFQRMHSPPCYSLLWIQRGPLSLHKTHKYAHTLTHWSKQFTLNGCSHHNHSVCSPDTHTCRYTKKLIDDFTKNQLGAGYVRTRGDQEGGRPGRDLLHGQRKCGECRMLCWAKITGIFWLYLLPAVNVFIFLINNLIVSLLNAPSSSHPTHSPSFCSPLKTPALSQQAQRPPGKAHKCECLISLKAPPLPLHLRAAAQALRLGRRLAFPAAALTALAFPVDAVSSRVLETVIKREVTWEHEGGAWTARDNEEVSEANIQGKKRKEEDQERRFVTEIYTQRKEDLKMIKYSN